MTKIKAENIIGLNSAIETHPDVEYAIEHTHEEHHTIGSHTDTIATGPELIELTSGDYVETHDHENWTINDGEGFNTPE